MKEILEPPRTWSRPFKITDAKAAFRWLGDPDVMRYVLVGGDRTVDDTRARVRHYMEHQKRYGFSRWIVFEKETGEAIGDAGFFHMQDLTRVELGYFLARNRWGRGLATEIAAAWLKAGFEKLGFQRVFALSHPDNSPSLRVMQKVGFSFLHTEVLYGMAVPIYVVEAGSRKTTSKRRGGSR